MFLDTWKKITRNFTLKFILLFGVIFVFTTGLSTYLFSRFIYRDVGSRLKMGLISTKDEIVGNLHEKRDLAFHYAQFISAAENIYIYPRSQTEEIRGLEMFIIEKARILDFDVDLIHVYPGEELEDEILKKGLTGVVTSSFTMADDLGRKLSIEAVSPVLEGGKVRKLVRVRYLVTRKYLLERKKSLGADITILSGGIVVASTSNCNECMVCFKEILSSGDYSNALAGGKEIYFEDACDPYYHSGVITAIDMGEKPPLYLFVTKEIGEEIEAYRKSSLAYFGGITLYSLIMIALFVVFARRFTRPVKRLTVMARNISEGNSGITVTQTRDDEIGDLERSLNEMSRKLADAFSQVEKRKKDLETLNAELKTANFEILGWNKKLEERVRAKSAELEHIHEKMVEVEKMAALGQVTAGIAKEMGGPLEGIGEYARKGLERLEKLSSRSFAEEPTVLKEYLQKIEDLSSRCGHIVSNLADLSIEKESLREELDLDEVVHATFAFFKRALLERGIGLRMDLSKDPKKVYGSSKEIRLALENLIINARNAMHGGGELQVKTRIEGDGAIVDIVDTARGITGEELDRIFDPSDTSGDVGRIAGPGLYVSYNIVRRHGGDISVRSEEGRGNTFTIRLPSVSGLGEG